MTVFFLHSLKSQLYGLDECDLFTLLNLNVMDLVYVVVSSLPNLNVMGLVAVVFCFVFHSSESQFYGLSDSYLFSLL